MQDTIEQLKHLFINFWEYRWLALSAAVLISIIGWVAVIVAPDKYEVNTRVYIDTRSMLKPILKGIAVDSEVTESTAEIMKRTLLSRPNLEAVARKSGMDAKIDSPRAYEKMLVELSEKIFITGGKDLNNIYTMSYKSRDPIMAKNIVQTLLDLFVERVIGANRLDTDITQRFLDEKIAGYEVRLVEAEQRLKEFKKEHPGVLVNDDRTYYTKLEAMRTQLQTAKLDLQEHKQRRTALSTQLKTTPTHTGGGTQTIGGGRSTSVQNPIDLSIQQAQSELDGLLLKYSDKHPDVSSAKRKIQQLKAQKASGAVGSVPLNAGNSGATSIRLAPQVNPTYQTLKLAYGEADAMVAALEIRVIEYEKRLVEMEASVDTLPDIEVKLAGLNRDYQVNKREYEELLKRRESASISEDVSNVDELQFEIIDPPRVPLLPVGPNRLKWITMVFFLAVGAGVGLSIALSMMRPKIYNKNSVKKITTLPILGSVSQLNTVGSHLSKGANNITYSLASGVLLLVYAALMLAYVFNMDYVRDYAGFGIKDAEQHLGIEVVSPISEAMKEL